MHRQAIVRVTLELRADIPRVHLVAWVESAFGSSARKRWNVRRDAFPPNCPLVDVRDEVDSAPWQTAAYGVVDLQYAAGQQIDGDICRGISRRKAHIGLIARQGVTMPLRVEHGHGVLRGPHEQHCFIEDTASLRFVVAHLRNLGSGGYTEP